MRAWARSSPSSPAMKIRPCSRLLARRHTPRDASNDKTRAHLGCVTPALARAALRPWRSGPRSRLLARRTRIVTASEDKELARIWDARNGSAQLAVLFRIANGLYFAAYSPDGNSHRDRLGGQDCAHLGCKHRRAAAISPVMAISSYPPPIRPTALAS